VSFAEAAQGGPWQFPCTVRAEVTQQQAFGLAMIGEPLRIVEQKMDQARELLTGATAADDPGRTSVYFTANTLLLRRATCYTEAGKPAKAAVLFGEVLGSGSLSRRDAGFSRARQAAALALSGEPDEAAAVGLQATQVAWETNSERTMRLLMEVLRTLAPWNARPGPRALKQAVATTPR
jgi:hypothetical protein